MIVFDTDLLTLLQSETGDAHQLLRDRLLDASQSDFVCVTIVSFEEQCRGWLSWIAAAKKIEDQVVRYKKLHQFHEDFKKRIIVDFDELSAREFQQLRTKKIRVGTMDLKIAAIALAKGATLLSRNLKDFRKIPGLVVEDWTRPL
jgi:tRNA(fMet)-specific endonuclease VapC